LNQWQKAPLLSNPPALVGAEQALPHFKHKKTRTDGNCSSFFVWSTNQILICMAFIIYVIEEIILTLKILASPLADYKSVNFFFVLKLQLKISVDSFAF